jgi:hypothetical protein
MHNQHQSGRACAQSQRRKSGKVQRSAYSSIGAILLAQHKQTLLDNRLAMQRFRASKENTPPSSQQVSALSGEAMPAVRTVHRKPMTAVPAAASGQRHEQPLAAMRTPASRRSDTPLPAAMTDSSARKGAALGIPPPADSVGGTHQSLGLDTEKALDAVYYREASLPIYHIHSYS